MSYIFIFGAKYAFVLSVLLWAWYLYKMRHDKQALGLTSLFIIASLGLTYAFGLIARHLYYNPRPFIVEGFTPLIAHIPDNGFPSDHVLLVAGLASVALLYNRKLSIYLWIIALFVAYSRVYVGVHHPLDVVVSIVIALAASGAVYLVLRKLFNAIINR
ncbi:phosphatase PAP2 family protein [Candidatus Parcubacteria bacterium]|nr:phosphatase PAP2 family protein [Candidatus Parcubacteria bacterium]